MSTKINCDLCEAPFGDNFHRIVFIDNKYHDKRLIKSEAKLDVCEKCFDEHIDSREPLDFLTGKDTLKS